MNSGMKLKYEEPKINIAIFETADIITTSGFEGEDDPLYEESA